ncbi:arginine ABC transporter permease ArtQ, partial [Vibrio cholerae]|nr:arginine ABC transporter permease ArtQ [Vibrio cholerae]
MVLTGYSLSLVQASWMTLQIALASLLVGLLLALVFAGGEIAKLKLIKWPTTLLVTRIPGFPELLWVLFLFFCSPPVLFFISGEFFAITPLI